MKNKLILLVTAVAGALALPSCVPVDYVGVEYTNDGYATLPRGYSTVYVGGSPYYYSRNYWYRRSNGRYHRCSRPHGYHGSIGRHSRYSHAVRPSYGSRGANVYHRSRGGGYRPASTSVRRSYGYRYGRSGYSGYGRSTNWCPVGRPGSRVRRHHRGTY